LSKTRWKIGVGRDLHTKLYEFFWSIAFTLLFIALRNEYPYAWDYLDPSWHRFVVFAVLVVGALLLFRLRQNNLIIYAWMEITFAIVSCWHACGSLQKDPSQWPVAIAAAYLFVRGLDNRSKAKVEIRKQLELEFSRMAPEYCSEADLR